MTISSENRKNQYDGNDSTTVFPYTFRITDQTQLEVILLDADGVTETTLTLSTHYTVSGVGDAGGGNVTYPVSGDPLATGETLTIRRNVPIKQLTDFENQGGFFADNHEDAFDYLTMVCLQLQEEIDRCPKLAATSEDDADTYLTTILGYKNDAETAKTAAEAAQTAAETAQTAAETAETNAETAETNIETIANGFTGDYDVDSFSGNGSYVNFTMSFTPTADTAILVTIDGVVQKPTTDYSVSGTTLTFTSAPPSGTNNVVVRHIAPAAILSAPSDGTVTLAKFATGLVKDEDDMASDSATSLASQQSIKAYVDATLQNLHPVGSVYINANVATNPGTLLGFGTWVAFGAGRVMVGLDSGDTDFDAAEETGGSKTVDASHNHGGTTGTKANDNQVDTTGSNWGIVGGHNHSISTDGSATQSVVQPYITVYMWKRTA